jgi:hypothetical protein
MATLVLTAVGAVIGGPVGAAIGASLGQQIDRRLLAPKGRDGPRLNDLAVQTSSYGSPIPKLFGRTRVSGTVIWATDLREERSRVSSGKGQPKQTIYSYSANFAVALSARRAGRIGRIWADGKLLRGSAGDFKTPTQFRYYVGGEDQAPDPLIASAEGPAPAYRGLAYAVFEDFQLADYGNRIPSLSFEVIADEAAPATGAIFNGIAGLDADCPTMFEGFVANGTSVRGVIEAIDAVVPLIVGTQATDELLFAEAAAAGAPPDPKDLGAAAGGRPSMAMSVERGSALALPASLALAYFDPARDYQPGLQRVRREGGAQREAQIDLAATLSATDAERLAGRGLARRWDERVGARIALPWRYLNRRPGEAIIVPGLPGTWRIAGAAFERMTLSLTLVRIGDPATVSRPSDPGRPVSEADVEHGPTTLALVDLPAPDAGVASAPVVVAAAAGVFPGWRRAALEVSIDGGLSWEAAGGTALPAVMGIAATVLAPGSVSLIDRINTLDVELLNAHMILSPADMPGLLTGRNLAIAGEELIQFESASPLGDRRYRLTGLLRGRRGTEWAMATHAVGERFLLLERETLRPLDVPAGLPSVRAMATGVGDIPDAATDIIFEPGQALRPLNPVHLRFRKSGDDIVIEWIRRSRNGWGWVDGVDAPLAEEHETYLVRVEPSIGAARVLTSGQPFWIYSAAERAADVAAGATSISVRVAQRGTYGASREAAISFPIV